MLTPEQSRQRLLKLLRNKRVVTLDALLATLQTRSRTSAFRRLSTVAYLTSYSHAGRYYTIAEIPKFDENGLWHHQGASFSRHGSLKNTVEQLVSDSEAGRTHAELTDILRVRVHNALLELTDAKRIGRVGLAKHYLYVNAKRRKAGSQVARRRQLIQAQSAVVAASEPTLVIEVLSAFIHHPGSDPASLAAVFKKKGKAISRDEIEAVFARYELGKKKRPRGARGPK